MKIIKITLISLSLITLTGCIGHKTNIHDEPIEFEAYTYQVTMDKDGNITYYKNKPTNIEE
jgi:hypothetical protein